MSPKMSFCPGTSDVIMSFRLVDTFGLLNPLIEFCYGWGAREPLFPARLNYLSRKSPMKLRKLHHLYHDIKEDLKCLAMG